MPFYADRTFQSTPVSEDGRTHGHGGVSRQVARFNPRPSVKTGEPGFSASDVAAMFVSIHARQ